MKNEEILLNEDEKSEIIEFDYPESFQDEEELITEQIREKEYKRIKIEQEQEENMNKAKGGDKDKNQSFQIKGATITAYQTSLFQRLRYMDGINFEEI